MPVVHKNTRKFLPSGYHRFLGTFYSPIILFQPLLFPEAPSVEREQRRRVVSQYKERQHRQDKIRDRDGQRHSQAAEGRNEDQRDARKGVLKVNDSAVVRLEQEPGEVPGVARALERIHRRSG